jgi:hypothetical protein
MEQNSHGKFLKTQIALSWKQSWTQQQLQMWLLRSAEILGPREAEYVLDRCPPRSSTFLRFTGGLLRLMRNAIVCFVVVLLVLAKPVCADPVDGGFSRYILSAVKMLGNDRAGLGYGAGTFTRDLAFGDIGELKATKPPKTMCVAAQLEVLIEAVRIYAEETKDYAPFHYIPKITWERLRPLDLRGQIWMVRGSPSTGAAHAFENFGMGKRIPFKDLFPGSFLNFNRTNKTGHGVVFLGFLDKAGSDLPQYSDEVAGFKYFSSQGKNKPDGGLGYRWAFFSDAGCPALSPGKKRDCGVLRSENNHLLVGGYVAAPNMWNQEIAAEQILTNNEATEPGLITEGVFDPDYFSGATTDD